MHVVAFVLLKVFVTDPLAHAVHANFESDVYLPAVHSEQFAAAVWVSVSVIEPG